MLRKLTGKAKYPSHVKLSIKKAQWGLHQNMELGDEVTNICTSGFLGYGKGLRFPGGDGPWFYLQGDSSITCKAEPVITMGVNQYEKKIPAKI